MILHRAFPTVVAISLLIQAAAHAESAGRPAWAKLADASGKFRLDRSALARTLERAPREHTEAARETEVILELPLPNGTVGRFRVEESPILSPAMTEKYGIHTYAARGLDDPGATARFDLGPTGFHALVLSTSGSVEVRPDGDEPDRYLSVRYEDDPLHQAGRCMVQDIDAAPAPVPATPAAPSTFSWSDEYAIYRVATAATGEFTAANGGTKASALAAITTIVNGINAIYRRDLGIHLDIVDNTDTVIYTDGATDPYTSGDYSCSVSSCFLGPDCLMNQNQCVLDLLLGTSAYDVGVVFDKAATIIGFATGSVCNNATKGKATTPSDGGVEVAAHEIGHMLNAHHTFNNGTDGSCGGLAGSPQRDGAYAWEPASGSTLMSYAGTCGAAADLQLHRDLVFHHKNVMDVRAFVAGAGATCADYAFSGNYPPVVQSVTAPTIVPKKTAFMLDVGFYDPQEDPVTVSWEEEDTGTASPPEGDDGTRPIFRAYAPRARSSRSFPDDFYVLYAASDPTPGAGNPPTGEALTTTTRNLHFGVILRDGQDGVTIAQTTVTVDAASGPFEITSPATGTAWAKGTKKTVTWNVAGTNAGAVNCPNVKILLSTDNGDTWDYVLAGSTPNDGTELVTLPFVGNTNSARIKVEAVGNIFYDISDSFGIGPLALTNTNDSGFGSLRQAIYDANDYPTGATIPVLLPGSGVRTIQVHSQLPTIFKPFALDGWELGGPDYTGPPLLEIDGSACPDDAPGLPCDGLVISGDNGNINGIVVRNFGGNGIVFRGAGAYTGSVQNSYIGTNATGTTAAGNGLSGVLIDGGHPDPAYRNILFGNVISGNKVGVTINGSTADGNALLGNKIGTNAAGTARIPNLDDGVRIIGAPNTIVGQPGDGNLISGNGTMLNGVADRLADAIDVSGTTASGTKIQSNLIGLDVTGSVGIFNTAGNIRITGAPNTLIGGTSASMRNVLGDDGTLNFHLANCIYVSGAASTGTVIQGNYIGTDATGTLDRGCRGAGVYVDSAPGVQIGGTTAAARNLISGNNDNGGVWISGSATGTLVRGNFIGTDVTGTVALPNNPYGIELFSGGNTIGGTVPGAGNVISGNTQRGIDISELPSSSNVIQGNFIGTNAAGTGAIGNGTYGIIILRSENNLIGGTVPGARNVISGNAEQGIFILGSPGQASNGNTIQGNYIGTDITGTVGIGNRTGVDLYDVKNVAVGGSVPAAGNVISAARDGYQGVQIYSSNLQTSGIVIQGNKIGTNAAGTAPLGNSGRGILGYVWGSASILGNVIAASGNNGIELSRGSWTIKGNWIGTDATGTLDLRNAWSGIYTESQDASEIGGAGVGEGNVVAFSSSPATGTNFAGVRVGGAALGQKIRGNRIFANTGLGIDLLPFGGVSGNDACDPDSGPNGSQNFPVLTAAYQSGSSTHVTGTLNSDPGTTFTIDFYASPACDSFGNGEGSTYLGSTTVPTDGSCNAPFDLIIPSPSSGVVTATATSPSGNTSEFSACRTVGPSPVAEVTGVVWASKTELTWNAATGATSYRVLRGKPSDFPDLLDADLDSCGQFAGAALTTGPVLTQDPLAAGVTFYWYLVVGSNGVDDGPYGAATAGPRIANASGSCP